MKLRHGERVIDTEAIEIKADLPETVASAAEVSA